MRIEDRYAFKHEVSVQETNKIIKAIRSLLGEDCEITIDTADAHYWNYKVDPGLLEKNWGDSIYSDLVDFKFPSLKICAEISDESKIADFYDCFNEYDCIRFSDENWHKITKKNITKEKAIEDVVDYYKYDLTEIMSFGDDLADIGMLKMSGLGVAMGNAIDEVKLNADIVIGNNDEDGIAVFLDGI